MISSCATVASHFQVAFIELHSARLVVGFCVFLISRNCCSERLTSNGIIARSARCMLSHMLKTNMFDFCFQILRDNAIVDDVVARLTACIWCAEKAYYVDIRYHANVSGLQAVKSQKPSRHLQAAVRGFSCPCHQGTFARGMQHIAAARWPAAAKSPD